MACLAITLRIRTRPTVAVENREEFNTAMYNAGALTARPFDLAPDGRILAPVVTLETQPTRASPRIHIVTNWFEELKTRVPNR
jgi:hypothetical protein